MKFCKDCIFYKRRPLKLWVRDECWRGGSVNMITGDKYARDARYERSAGYLCGPDASHFEPKS